MNHLIAKTKGKRGSHFKVLSDKTIFSTPEDLKNAVAYDPKYKREDEEWFAVPEFSKQEYCIPLLKGKFVSAEHNQLPKNDYANIDYLCSVQGNNFHFQKVTTSSILKKKYFSISDSPKLKTNEPIIIINNYSDAIYSKDIDTLLFRRLPSITSIFKGIEILYREATDDETNTFLQNSFIKCEDGFDIKSVKSANRKRIALAMDALNKLPFTEKKNMFSYIQQYCPKLKFKDDSFEVKTEDDLKQILFGIDQRYYTTPFGNEMRIANSVISILS